MKSSIEYGNTKTALVAQLLDWLNHYAGLISAITGILTLFVWTFYAHLLYRNFRRQRLPRLVIQISPDLEQHSMCLVINMSREVLNVAAIMVVGYSCQNIYKRKILDYEQFSRNWQANTSQEWRSLLKQGPLEVGGFLVLGSFESILREVASSDCHPRMGKNASESIHTLEIRAIAFFGSENDPLGVYRAFNIAPKPEGLYIRPQTFKTQHLTSLRQRHIVRQWLQDYIELE